MEAIGFFQSKVDPFVWYSKEMVILFYVDSCLMFSTSKDKIYGFHAWIQADFKIDYNRGLNKYLGIELDRRPYVSINLNQPYLTQRIINLIPGMYNSSSKPTPMAKPYLEKNEGDQQTFFLNYRPVVVSLNLLTNPMRTGAQFVVRKCKWFSANTKHLHYQSSICILKYLNHIRELPGNYPVFTMIMVIFHYVDRICRILVTPFFV